MITVETLIDQTLAVRQMIVQVLKSIPVEQADVIPPTWHNNARWHAGHLIITPCLLSHGLLKEPLTVPEEYRAWFAKGSSPTVWPDKATLPSYADLIDELVPLSGRLIESFKDRMDETYLEPYSTTVGIVLHNPAEAFNMSVIHDGIHLGMLLALRRALQASNI
jgi:hypothetical protein